MQARPETWIELAKRFNIRIPSAFVEIQEDDMQVVIAWKFLSAAEALSLKAELDLRYNYPGREWRGIPFARSTVSEDVACFDLAAPPGEEARVIPIRDWHGPRWEYSGDFKTFNQWLCQDSKGHLT